MLDELVSFRTQYVDATQAYNKSIDDNCHAACPTCGHDIAPSVDAERRHKMIARKSHDTINAVRDEMLADPRLRLLVATHSICFMSDPEEGFESNYDIDELVEENFPWVVTDSESGQGWVYCNEAFVDQMVEFLEPRCLEVTVCDDRKTLGNWYSNCTIAWDCEVIPDVPTKV